jgi:hypothetical protein
MVVRKAAAVMKAFILQWTMLYLLKNGKNGQKRQKRPFDF